MQLQVFTRGQVAVETVLLRDHTDHAADGAPLGSGVKPFDERFAPALPHERRQDPDQRGLAGTVGAKQAEDRPLLHRQVERVERGKLTVGLGQGTGDYRSGRHVR